MYFKSFKFYVFKTLSIRVYSNFQQHGHFRKYISFEKYSKGKFYWDYQYDATQI